MFVSCFEENSAGLLTTLANFSPKWPKSMLTSKINSKNNYPAKLCANEIHFFIRNYSYV